MKKVIHFAPEGFGYSTNQVTEGFHLLKKAGLIRQFICTNKVVHHGSKLEDLELTPESDALDQCEDADMIIISTDGDREFSKGVRGACLQDRRLRPKIAFVDGCDSNQFLIDPHACRVYFKREHRYPEWFRVTASNIRSLQFGVYDFHLDGVMPGYEQRDIDIAFVAFGGSSASRAACAEYLNTAKRSAVIKKVCVNVMQDGQPLSIDEYRKTMRSSKIIVNMPGAGLDTLRFWEAMGFGAILFSYNISGGMYLRDMPEAHRHVIYFDHFDQMFEHARTIVSDKDVWQRMRNATDKLIRCYHTTTKRAGQMIAMFEELS